MDAYNVALRARIVAYIVWIGMPDSWHPLGKDLSVIVTPLGIAKLRSRLVDLAQLVASDAQIVKIFALNVAKIAMVAMLDRLIAMT